VLDAVAEPEMEQTRRLLSFADPTIQCFNELAVLDRQLAIDFAMEIKISELRVSALFGSYRPAKK
jgi:hypothetical protein